MTVPTSPEKNRVRAERTLVLCVLVALALRLAVVPFNSLLFEDLMDANHIHAWEQGNVARALLAGKGFGSPLVSNQPSAIMPPVYPLIVAGFFRVFGIHTYASITAIHVFDCLINSLACVPIFLIARRSFGERVAWWAAWGWAFFPYGIYFAAAWAWSTHLLLLCLCWLIYLAQDLERSSRLWLWAGFGLLAGFAGLTEPSVLAVVAFLMVLACWRLARDGKRWLLPGVVASLTIAAALSPWMIRNALVFHRFIPMRDSMGLELWMGNNGVSHSLDQTSDDLHPLHDMAELADYNRMGELAYMDHRMQQAKAFIRANPGLVHLEVLCAARSTCGRVSGASIPRIWRKIPRSCLTFPSPPASPCSPSPACSRRGAKRPLRPSATAACFFFSRSCITSPIPSHTICAPSTRCC